MVESSESPVPVLRLKSPAGWMPTHRDQLRALRSTERYYKVLPVLHYI